MGSTIAALAGASHAAESDVYDLGKLVVTAKTCSGELIGGTVVNLSADHALTDNVTATAAVRNVGDQDDQLTDGFPEAGRSFYLSLRARF